MTVEEEPTFSNGLYDLALQIDDLFVIGTKYEHEIEDNDFFNHSCNPNAGFRGQIFLVAMRDIDVNEEITFVTPWWSVMRGGTSSAPAEVPIAVG